MLAGRSYASCLLFAPLLLILADSIVVSQEESGVNHQVLTQTQSISSAASPPSPSSSAAKPVPSAKAGEWQGMLFVGQVAPDGEFGERLLTPAVTRRSMSLSLSVRLSLHPPDCLSVCLFTACCSFPSSRVSCL